MNRETPLSPRASVELLRVWLLPLELFPEHVTG
jgi:hypothetical protein